MDLKSKQPTTILFSLPADGSAPKTWHGGMASYAYKTCQHCGMDFRPWSKQPDAGRVRHQARQSFEKARFCSISCSKKAENAMWAPGAKEKMSASLQRIGHKPSQPGGNGRGMTEPQQAILSILGDGWLPELVIRTNLPKNNGQYPTSYKVDIGNEATKVAIELDGQSHYGKRKELDTKKDAMLASLGWKVYRVKNWQVPSLCSTCKSADTLLTLLDKS